jgi:translation initiation factor 2B subunit (eIF-2B alpha/beta/delta family)
MKALVVPDIRELVLPVGWAETEVMPLAASATWEEIDEYEARLRAVASYIESLDGDAVELEKALRIIEARRGELLDDPAMRGRVEVAERTGRRYRTIAQHWEEIWPEISAAKDRRQVSQAAVMRMISDRFAAQEVETSPVIPAAALAPGASDTAPEQEEAEESPPDTIQLMEDLLRTTIELAAAQELVRKYEEDAAGSTEAQLRRQVATLSKRIESITRDAQDFQRRAERAEQLLAEARKLLRVESNADLLNTLREWTQ